MTEPSKKIEKNSPEVTEKAVRRQFTLEFKNRIVAEADRCQAPGEIGALLRREGLYWSTLQRWRTQRNNGTLGNQARGRKPKPNTRELQELDKLKRQNERLTEKLRHAELIIEVQKKVSEMIKLSRTENVD